MTDHYYKAFISYSHRDSSWAKWIHKRLESFKVADGLIVPINENGKSTQTLKPIFRDRNDFNAGHSLTEQTLTALSSSAALIVICSRASAASKYVTEEVRLFRSHYPERPVVPIIIEGDPNTGGENECFPNSLRFIVEPSGKVTEQIEDVIAADARESGDGKDLAFSKVVATLLGVQTDQIFRREERRKRRRLHNGMLFAATLALSFLGIASLAEVNRREAEKRLGLAQEATLKDLVTVSTVQASMKGESFANTRSGNKALVGSSYQKVLQEYVGSREFVSFDETPNEFNLRKIEILLEFAREPGWLSVFGMRDSWIDEAERLLYIVEDNEPIKGLRDKISHLKTELSSLRSGPLPEVPVPFTQYTNTSIGLPIGVPNASHSTDGQIEIGENFQLEVTSAETGRVVIFEIGPDGQVRFASAQDWKISAAERPLKITFIATYPIGISKLLVFVVPESHDMKDDAIISRNPEYYLGQFLLNAQIKNMETTIIQLQAVESSN